MVICQLYPSFQLVDVRYLGFDGTYLRLFDELGVVLYLLRRFCVSSIRCLCVSPELLPKLGRSGVIKIGVRYKKQASFSALRCAGVCWDVRAL